MRVPDGYNLFRYIDYHPDVDWAIGFIALSPYNECFIFDELNISPRTNTTEEIVYEIAEKSGHYKFKFDVIDPLAEGNKSNTKNKDGTVKTTRQDINKCLADFKRQGICEGGNFVSGNTKGTRGREKIRARIKNSIITERPFNNDAEKYRDKPDVVNIDREPYLPTLWIFSHCKKIRTSLKNVRTEKDGKPTPSLFHHVSGLEFLHKDSKFRPPILMDEYERSRDRDRNRAKIRYFQGVR